MCLPHTPQTQLSDARKQKEMANAAARHANMANSLNELLPLGMTLGHLSRSDWLTLWGKLLAEISARRPQTKTTTPALVAPYADKTDSEHSTGIRAEVDKLWAATRPRTRA